MITKKRIANIILHHLQVLGDHHCTLVHPCKTENLESVGVFISTVPDNQIWAQSLRTLKYVFEPPTYQAGWQEKQQWVGSCHLLQRPQLGKPL